MRSQRLPWWAVVRPPGRRAGRRGAVGAGRSGRVEPAGPERADRPTIGSSWWATSATATRSGSTDGERVRMIGIDTPEVDEGECFAIEATDALRGDPARGTAIRLRFDDERTDRFGRTLAYVAPGRGRPLRQPGAGPARLRRAARRCRPTSPAPTRSAPPRRGRSPSRGLGRWGSCDGGDAGLQILRVGCADCVASRPWLTGSSPEPIDLDGPAGRPRPAPPAVAADAGAAC